MVGSPREADVIRVLVPAGAIVAGATLLLPDDEGHHLQVRRVPDGTSVEALDLHGVTAQAVVTRSARTWSITVGTPTRHAPLPATVLAVGAGDRDRFLHLVEQVTPLGVTRIIPLVTERTAHVATRWRPTHRERAGHAAAAACKQSGMPWAPVIDAPRALADFVAAPPPVRWLLAAPAAGPRPGIAAAESVGWCIGPEGGFTAAEEHLLTTRLLAHPVSLGAWILRFETAAVVAAAITADRRCG